jgi:hypothetical protein
MERRRVRNSLMRTRRHIFNWRYCMSILAILNSFEVVLGLRHHHEWELTGAISDAAKKCSDQ